MNSWNLQLWKSAPGSLRRPGWALIPKSMSWLFILEDIKIYADFQDFINYPCRPVPVSYVSTYTLFSEYLLVSRHRGRYIHIAVYILTPRRFADFINSSLQKALKIYADFPDINNFLCVLCMYAPFSEYVLVSGQTGRIHIVVNILIPHSFCGVS